jgi:PleD family two-component response regulator
MPESRVSVDELLSVADAACYRAKTLGRNRIETQVCEVPRLSDPSRKQ